MTKLSNMLVMRATFQNYQHEAVAAQDQTLINLPFEYIVGAKNLSLTINGVRQFPSKFTEVDSTTIQLTDGLDAGDDILVESVPMGAYGAIPLSQDSNKLGGTSASGFTQIITEDLDLYVSLTGNDGNDGSEAYPFATLQAAYDYVKNKWISESAMVSIIIEDGLHPTAELYVEHPCGSSITVRGKNGYVTSLISIYSHSGLSGAYTLVLSIGDASNAQIGNYVLISNSAIEDPSSPNASYQDPEYVMGIHEITAVDKINNRITVLSKNSLYPSGTFSADIVIIPTILEFSSPNGIEVSTDLKVKNLLLKGLILEDSTGITALHGGYIDGENCGVIDFQTGFSANQAGTIVITRGVSRNISRGYYASTNGTIICLGAVSINDAGMGFFSNIFGAIYCDNAIAIGGGYGFFAAAASNIIATSARALNTGYGFLAKTGSAGYIYTGSAIKCSNVGYYCSENSTAYCGASKAELCGTGYYAANGGYISRGSSTVYNNTTDYSPTVGVTGNSFGAIT